MNNRSYSSKHIEQYLQLWIYLLPVVGVIPAIWTLYRAKNNSVNSPYSQRLLRRPKGYRSAYKTTEPALTDGQPQSCAMLRQREKASRLSINLTLIWLSSYALFSLGAANVSELMSFRLLYSNAIITTGYFLTCTWLMSRLGKKKLFSPDDMG